MKLVLDIDTSSKPIEIGDTIFFNGKKWVSVSHNVACKNELQEIKELKAQVRELKDEVVKCKAHINELARVLKGEL